MKERPILFSGPMVRAILDGRKTMTRRVVKWKYGENGTPACPIESVDRFADIVQGLAENLSGDPVPFCEAKCPFGVPGDRLWVRETWQDIGAADRPEYVYAADGEWSGKWRPSIHMPRWASRITLEVVSVRVDRLEDISEEDAKAEGYASADEFLGAPWAVSVGPNPWVWVVEFRRMNP